MVAIVMKFGNIYKYTSEKRKPFTLWFWIRYLIELELVLGKWFKLEHSLSIESFPDDTQKLPWRARMFPDGGMWDMVILLRERRASCETWKALWSLCLWQNLWQDGWYICRSGDGRWTMWGDIRKKRQFKCLPNVKQKVSWGWSSSLGTDCLLHQKSMLGQLFKDNAWKLPYSTNSHIDTYDSVTAWVPVSVVGEVTKGWLGISDFVWRNCWRWRGRTSTRNTNPQVTIIYQLSSVPQSCPTLCDPMDCSTPGLPVHHQLPESETQVSWLTQWCHPTMSSSVGPFSSRLHLSQHQGVFHELDLCIRWPKYWSFSFNISPSSEYVGLISFGMDWLDLLAVQGTLKSLLQHHSSKASIFQCSALFIVQISHPYMTTGKTITLTTWTLVGKVMSLLFNMLSSLVITFHPRSKCLLIAWLQSSSTEILEPPKISLPLFPLSPDLFAMKWRDQMPWL